MLGTSRLLGIVLLSLSTAALAQEPPAPAAGASSEAPIPSAPASVPVPKAPAEKAGQQPLPNESVATKSSAAAAAARYSLRRVDGGFLRFDAQTGDIAFCSSKGESWGCQAVPQERATLEQEVERLRAENAELKKQLNAAEEPPRPPKPIPPPQPPSTAPSPKNGNGDMTFSIPGRAHLVRAAAIVQDAWQHFVALVVGLKNDVLHKSG
jgi:hypothetical protein